MIYAIRFLLGLFTLLLVVPPLAAQSSVSPPPQKQQRILQFDAGSSLFLREIGALVAEEKGKLFVRLASPKGALSAEAPNIDLAVGDEIGMAAGKRVESLKELTKAYESTAVGSEFKFGVRRDGQPHVIRFIKKAESEMPGGMRMMVQQRGAGDENSDIFPAFGIGIAREGKQIVISEVLPHAPKGIVKGDVVKSLNGTAIGSISDFSKTFDATRVGGALTLELLRNGTAVTVTGTRLEPAGPVIIRRETK